MNHPDSPLTFKGDNSTESWIDVSAAFVELIDRAVNWRVETTAGLGFDHKLLLWELMISSPEKAARTA